MIAVAEGREVVGVLQHRSAACDLEVEEWESQVARAVVGSEEEEWVLRQSKQAPHLEDSHAIFEEMLSTRSR